MNIDDIDIRRKRRYIYLGVRELRNICISICTPYYTIGNLIREGVVRDFITNPHKIKICEELYEEIRALLPKGEYLNNLKNDSIVAPDYIYKRIEEFYKYINYLNEMANSLKEYDDKTELDIIKKVEVK
jgi:hypothetical protein